MKRWVIAGALLAGCGTSTGDLEVRVEAEDTIPLGLEPGGDEGTVDGWTVSFERYLVVVGGPVLEGGGPRIEETSTVALDLARLPEGGHRRATFAGVASGAWPTFRFTTPIATADTIVDASADAADVARMVDEGCTYLITGTILREAESVDFDLCVPAATEYGPCESDTGIEGAVIAAGTTTTVNVTFHGDHLFFNGFPAGEEGTVARRAQWLADADTNGDGSVGREELEAIGSSELGTLFPSAPADGMPGYSLGNSPIPIATAWDFVRGELMTQGHFQGEGECPSSPL